jgi:low affinity Fe/Cu permease
MTKGVIINTIKKSFVRFSETLSSFLKAGKRYAKPKIVKLSKLGGSLGAFTVSLAVVIIWALCGPFFNYSDSWQLVINTGTTIVTFLMAFSIQFSQNRDTKQITMILKSLMKQNEALREQLEAIEKEMEEDDN